MRAIWMKCAAGRQVRGDLASTRQSAALFLNNPPLRDRKGYIERQSITEWIEIGDANSHLAESYLNEGRLEKAAEAELCALTAFEVARRLTDEDDARWRGISARIEAGIERIGLCGAPKVEPVQISCADQVSLFAYYLPAGRTDLPAPAIICVCSEQDTPHALLGRVLPVVLGRGISLLVLSHGDLVECSRGSPRAMLSSCLDYLSRRSDVDSARVATFGDGLSAALASDFVASDSRVAAAVCDGGLWHAARALAYVDWMTKAAGEMDELVVAATRLRQARQLRCPVLVVAGGRGIVSIPEASKLQAACVAARIELELIVAPTTSTAVGELEDFPSCDDAIFGWLQHKLFGRSAPEALPKLGL